MWKIKVLSTHTFFCDFLNRFISLFLSFLLSVFVFKPSEPRPLFSHKAVCSGKVTQAVFAPREEMLESCEESSQWLNRSQLYFLTQQMVNNISTSAEEKQNEKSTNAAYVPGRPVFYWQGESV